jgi:hypothetical protein
VRWRLWRGLRRQTRLSGRRFCTVIVTRADSVSTHMMRVPIETEMNALAAAGGAEARGAERGLPWNAGADEVDAA